MLKLYLLNLFFYLQVMQISSQLVSDWLQYSVVLQNLSLPKQNQFIPRDFVILSTSTATSQPIKADPGSNNNK